MCRVAPDRVARPPLKTVGLCPEESADHGGDTERAARDLVVERFQRVGEFLGGVESRGWVDLQRLDAVAPVGEDLRFDGHVERVENRRQVAELLVEPQLELAGAQAFGKDGRRIGGRAIEVRDGPFADQIGRELGVRSAADLETAIAEGRFRSLPGMKDKKEARIRRGLEVLRAAKERAT